MTEIDQEQLNKTEVVWTISLGPNPSTIGLVISDARDGVLDPILNLHRGEKGEFQHRSTAFLRSGEGTPREILERAAVTAFKNINNRNTRLSKFPSFFQTPISLEARSTVEGFIAAGVKEMTLDEMTQILETQLTS